MEFFGIALSSTSLWLLGLAGTAIAWLVVHRLDIWRDKQSRKAAANAAFRSAVLAELGTIYPHAPVWPENIGAFLKAHFTALQKAVETFRPYVPLWHRWRFDRAWDSYRLGPKPTNTIQCYHHYMEFDDNLNYKANFHTNVKRLLSFADET